MSTAGMAGCSSRPAHQQPAPFLPPATTERFYAPQAVSRVGRLLSLIRIHYTSDTASGAPKTASHSVLRCSPVDQDERLAHVVHALQLGNLFAKGHVHNQVALLWAHGGARQHTR